jgi:hypothetical protein
VVGRRITVVGSLSSATVVVPNVQAGCPAVVQVIDAVLLPDLAEEGKPQGLLATLASIWATGGASAEAEATT